MKKKIAWITDSTSGLTPESGQKLGIHVLPLSVVFGNEAFKEGIDITNEEFYKRLTKSKELPTSSQPTVGEAVEFFEKLKEEYEVGVVLHISSELSGTYHNSLNAAKMVDFPVIGIDSRAGGDAVVSMIKTGQKLESDGLSLDEIENHLVEMTNKVKGYIVIGNLEQIAKSGRVSNTQAFIGNLLKINLIIKLEDGKLVPSDKIRTTKKAHQKALQYLFDAVDQKKNIQNISIVSTTTPTLATEWAELIEINCPNTKPNITGLSPVIGVHGGAGTIGVFWFEN